MAKKSRREMIVDEMNEALLNINPGNVNEIYSRLIMHINSFPLFRLSLTLKKKNQMVVCDGYCKNNQNKHKKNSLNSFPNHHHMFCSFCLKKWIEECFNKNPNNPIACQRCTTLNEQGPTFSDNDISNILQLYPEHIEYYRQNYQDPSTFIYCSSCSTQIHISAGTRFLCTHILCYTCIQTLIINTLNYYWDMICDRSQDISNLIFEIRCLCNNEISSQNDFVQNLQIYLIQFNIEKRYIDFVTDEKFANFFAGRAKLIRCPNQNCGNVEQLLQMSMTCKSCSHCMKCCQRSHPGLTCDEMQKISGNNKYEIINLNSPMLPQPPEGVKHIVDLYSKLTSKIEQSFNIPRKIAKIWEIKNPYLEYYFGFAKQKDYIFSDLMDQQTCNNIVTNNFTADSKNMITFPQKINSVPEKKFIFYLEVMFDELRNADPDTLGDEERTQKQFMLKCLNLNCFNSLLSIRILMMLELN